MDNSKSANSPACYTRTSATTRNEQNLWNFGGAQLGGGAANLVSSAFFAIPSFALDLVKGVADVPGQLFKGIAGAFGL